MTVKELTLTDNYEIVHLGDPEAVISLSLIHISEPTRRS